MTDKEVIDKFADLVHYIALSRTSQPSDADDAFQEVFFRYVRKQPKFHSDEHAKAWFIRVTVNVCNNMFRANRKKQEMETDGETAPEVLSDKDFAAAFEEHQWLSEKLAALKPRYREVLLLRFDCGYSIREVAGAMGETEGTVKMMLTRAKRQLRALMIKEDE